MPHDTPEEAYFIKTVFYVFIDNVITGLTARFNAVKKLAKNCFLWKYLTMRENEQEKKARCWHIDILQTLLMRIMQKKCYIFKFVHKANFGKPELNIWNC